MPKMIRKDTRKKDWFNKSCEVDKRKRDVAKGNGRNNDCHYIHGKIGR